jgi:hypothetical protein
MRSSPPPTKRNLATRSARFSEGKYVGKLSSTCLGPESREVSSFQLESLASELTALRDHGTTALSERSAMFVCHLLIKQHLETFIT